MEEKNINRLLKLCDEYFLQSRHCKHYIQHCKNTWYKGILSFMNELGVEDYSPDIGQKYLLSASSALLVEKYPRVIRRGIHMLDDLFSIGRIRRRCYTKIDFPLEGEIGGLAKDFLACLQESGRKERTLYNHRRHLSRLISYLTDKGVAQVAGIEESHLISYMSAVQLEKRSVTISIKGFVRYLKNNRIIGNGLDYFLDNFKAHDKERIPSFYSEAEILRIEGTINRNTSLGKRDCAIVLLASRLGLRAADIAGLKFSHIDWQKSEIRLTTQKTGKVVELPLLAEVGNAIIDYLKNGRPHSSSENIFLLARAPYCEITSRIVSNVVQSVMRKSGIDISQRKHGPHSLRHSLATNMLGLGATMPTISEVLGHQSSETTSIYLKIDIQSLRKCVLPVPEVSKRFYEQKGGPYE